MILPMTSDDTAPSVPLNYIATGISTLYIRSSKRKHTKINVHHFRNLFIQKPTLCIEFTMV